MPWKVQLSYAGLSAFSAAFIAMIALTGGTPGFDTGWIPHIAMLSGLAGWLAWSAFRRRRNDRNVGQVSVGKARDVHWKIELLYAGGLALLAVSIALIALGYGTHGLDRKWVPHVVIVSGLAVFQLWLAYSKWRKCRRVSRY
jgi:4-hydroxybenzoate polyprenyltransferase